jgi:integrase
LKDVDALPFNEQEAKKILNAWGTFNGSSERIKALAELTLSSGLRIGDAATISRDKFVKDGDGWKLELRTAKTRVFVFIPLQKQFVEAIQRLPGKYVFWSGESTPANCTSVRQEGYWRLFKHAGIAGHPHRFRHAFGKNLRVNEVPLETVSLLLDHRKLAITEKRYARFVPERQVTWARVGQVKK